MEYISINSAKRSELFSLCVPAQIETRLMFFIAIIGVVYMVNFNNNATMGYQLTMLESERNALKNVREQQNIDLTRSQSIDFIRNSPRVRIMLPTYEVEYFDGKSELAYRR
jgi:hypothetical protein